MVYIAKQKTREELLEAFEKNFVKGDGCWNWIGKLTAYGYSYFYMGKGWPGGTKGSHGSRAAWALYNGAIPKGMCICHHCDNPKCVNPAHLFLGTDYDNTLDKMNKERQSRGPSHGEIVKRVIPRGIKHYNSKLTEEDIKRICEYRANGETYKQIAARFNVNFTAIHKIVNRKSWTHADREVH